MAWSEKRVDDLLVHLHGHEACRDGHDIRVVVLAASRANSGVVTLAARTPATLLAAIAIPIPVPHTRARISWGSSRRAFTRGSGADFIERVRR